MKWKMIVLVFLIFFSLSAHALENYYKILGITATASPEEIKKAYRVLAMKYHPDRNGGTEVSKKMFQKMKEAYEILSDTAKRAEYDRAVRAMARSAYASTSASSRSSATMNPSDDVKKYQWQNFEEPVAKAQPKEQPTYSKPEPKPAAKAEPKSEPKAEAKAQSKPASEAPVETQAAAEPKVSPKVSPEEKAPSKVDPRMKMYNTPSCGRGFLGTVIDVLI